MEKKEYVPNIVAFCCNWCRTRARPCGLQPFELSANVKIIRVPCSCRVNPMFVLKAFRQGADGVIFCGCHPGDCHYVTGNYYTRRRMALLFSFLNYLGIEKERTRVEWVSAAEGARFLRS
ncbi:MAG: hydrogenase iron-sulfur subunit [Christensenellaceae bacterium]